MSKMIYVSPSQLGVFRSCRYKWAYQYLEGMRSPPSPATMFGEEVHTALEGWLEHGIEPPDNDAGEVARQGLGLLPPPKAEGLVIEDWLKIKIAADVTLRGKADCLQPGDVPVVIDHKSTSDLRWAKTVDDLKTDPQAIFYGRAAMERFETDSVLLRWIYYVGKKPRGGDRPRKPGGTRAVELLVTRDDIAEEWRRLKKDALTIADFRRSNTWPLNWNRSHCGAYGGCHVLKPCVERRNNLTVLDDTVYNEEQKGNTTMTDLAAMMAAAEAKTKAKKEETVNPPKVEAEDLPEDLKAEVEGKVEPVAEKPKTEKKTATKRGRPKGAAKKGFSLYVDCAPLKGATAEDFSDWIKPVLEEFDKEYGTHWKLIDFGKGAGFLIQGTEKYLAENPPKNSLVISTRTPEGALLRDVFARAAEQVIQGGLV